MIKDMYEIIRRIGEIKERFGLKRHNVVKESRDFQKSLKQNIQNIERSAIDANASAKGDVSLSKVKEVATNYAAENSVPASLVNAIIETESSFNPYAISRKGAKGLMQLMPAVIESMNVDDPFNIQDNIRAGVTHFRRLLDKYNWDYKLALAAYNAGEGAVDKNRDIPPYKETRQYVRKVLNAYLENI